MHCLFSFGWRAYLKSSKPLSYSCAVRDKNLTYSLYYELRGTNTPTFHWFFVGFSKMPSLCTRRIMSIPAKFLVQLWCIMFNPTVNCGVVDIYTTLSQHFLKLTVTDAVLTVPSYCPQDDNTGEITTFKCIHEVSFRSRLVNISIMYHSNFATSSLKRHVRPLKASRWCEGFAKVKLNIFTMLNR